MNVENCWILQGQIQPDLWWVRMLTRTTGTPVSVEFDYKLAYQIEDATHDIVGFMHTHPGFSATPSVIDHSTMNAWVQCFGKNLICLIHGTDGLRGFLYTKGNYFPYEYERVERLGQNIIVGLCYAFDYQNKHENDDAEQGGLSRPAKKSTLGKILDGKITTLDEVMESKILEELEDDIPDVRIDPWVLEDDIPDGPMELDPEDDGIVISARLEDPVNDELECPHGHGLVKASEGYRCQKCGWNAILFDL